VDHTEQEQPGLIKFPTEQEPAKEARANVWFNESELKITITALRCYITLAPEFDRVEKTVKIQKVYNDLMKVQRDLSQYRKQKLANMEKEIARAQGTVVAGCKGDDCD
jgi:ASC-1-like (ASCH) protein